MASGTNAAFKMKVFPKGQVVIPVALRKKYKIEIGDHIEIIQDSNGILLKPAAKTKGKPTTTDKLYGVFSDYALKRPGIKKKDIEKATGTGFTEGWPE